ncbi:MAG: sugar ABC transporter permease [Lachnospiraceae bacterium]|nr:sugar ABC transporter permease [Lachnospiraceae bacterium]MCD7832704.1 sugar ABC transporter permease [Lachnospiraceae bacterium]
MNGKKKIRAYRRRDYHAFIYLAPWLIGLCVLQLYPFLSSLYYSFTDYQITSSPVWAGLKNYITLFTADKEFITSLSATIRFTLMTVPGKLILALAVAVFLNRDIKGINLIRTFYYIPSLFGGSIAIAMLWKVMFMDNGVVNALLNSIGISSVSWLGNPKVALRTICMLEIWQFGSSMVMFLAALKQVPRELYEAASIDGAGKIRKFFSITVPQITSIIFFNMIMQTINALQAYTSAAVITDGGPLKATYLLGLKLYKEGFSYFKMGYASAISWVMFAIILVVTLLLFRFSNTWVYYEDSDVF